MDNKNEVIIDGIKYVAVEEENGCEGCAFDNNENLCTKIESIHCTAGTRKDERNVIFKRKDMEENHNENDISIFYSSKEFERQTEKFMKEIEEKHIEKMQKTIAISLIMAIVSTIAFIILLAIYI